ncbi:LytTR family DNA-binding domain-containing protein [Kordiimonas aquimaris]|uniref:LytTR family DNA-binding domain-containing protein n=1 Tax=Kordiimonas aquimaris TaxID=707591 RepID=UPI0021CE271F|nr:LytTR family DNA-binding domain-containing protein [Kordiimonas aquimaris]
MKWKQPLAFNVNSKVLAAINQAPVSGLNKTESLWSALHWAGALAFALLLFLFDALETIFYTHARAPNVGLVAQLLLLLFFYSLWALVVRYIWLVTANFMTTVDAAKPIRPLIARLAVGAVALNLLHMIVLATILRIMYSPPGWGVYDFVTSVTELWLRYAGLWGAVYAAFAILAYYRLRGLSADNGAAGSLVYEVRHGNRIFPLDVSDICWVEAAENYVQLHTNDGNFLHRKSLASIAKEASAFGLIQTHRSALVNTAFVRAIVRGAESGAYHVELTTGAKVPLSRRRMTTVREQTRLA